MFITKKHLDRRTFLRGAFGTAIALPLLDAMVPAGTAQAQTAAAAGQCGETAFAPEQCAFDRKGGNLTCK